MATLLLVEDVAELRRVVRLAIEVHPELQVVAEAGDGASAVEAASTHQPDVVVLDLGLPDLAGTEVVRRLREAAPFAAVIVYTGTVGAGREALAEQVEAVVRKDQGVRYLVELLLELGRLRPAAALELGPHVGDVAEARHFLLERCRRWGCSHLVDDAELVLSELVTNALVHAGSRCRVAIGFDGTVLRIEVTDRSSGLPDVQAPDRLDDHGRGLLLVSLLAAAWGVETTAVGKLVWAELAPGDRDRRVS